MTSEQSLNDTLIAGSLTPSHPDASRRALWAGRAVAALATLFMLMDGVMKVARPVSVVEASAKLGYEASTLPGIGVALIVCTLLYALPRTSIFGAVLITGYLGGAIASQVRAGAGWFELMFPILFAVLVWGGLWLKDSRMRRILALASARGR